MGNFRGCVTKRIEPRGYFLRTYPSVYSWHAIGHLMRARARVLRIIEAWSP